MQGGHRLRRPARHARSEVHAGADRGLRRSQLRPRRRVAKPSVVSDNRLKSLNKGGGGGSRRIRSDRRGPLESSVVDAAPADTMDASGRGRTSAVASLATALAQAVLAGAPMRTCGFVHRGRCPVSGRRCVLPRYHSSGSPMTQWSSSARSVSCSRSGGGSADASCPDDATGCCTARSRSRLSAEKVVA